MTGTVGDSGDTWGLHLMSPGWTLIDKQLTPLGTWDNNFSLRSSPRNVPIVTNVSNVPAVTCVLLCLHAPGSYKPLNVNSLSPSS